MNNKTNDAGAVSVPSGRIARLSRLSSMTAGVAGNMAVNGLVQLGQGQRPSMRNLLLTPQNVTRIADQLAKMRGAAMKIGQLMSMDTGDVLPPELAQIMARLRDDAHFMPPSQLKQVLNTNWPDGWLRQFKKFDVRPIAAASIGQVHRAQLKDGRDLAIKVQYPGVARSIDSDVANVGVLMRMSGLLPKGFELAPYLEEARKQLHDETDYDLEGRHLMQFGSLLGKCPEFVVPELHSDWTAPGILAMSYIEGISIESAGDAPQEVRNEIAKNLIELTLKELFEFGLMQTDPNFANYLYKPETGQIVLLDFGATRAVDPVIIAQYRELMRAGRKDDAHAIEQIALQIGFFAPDTPQPHKNRIIKMIRLAFGVLTDAPKLDFTRTDLSQQMQAEGMALAQEGFVPPPLPIDVLLLQRKFGGMFLLAGRLGAKVDLTPLWEAYLG